MNTLQVVNTATACKHAIHSSVININQQHATRTACSKPAACATQLIASTAHTSTYIYIHYCLTTTCSSFNTGKTGGLKLWVCSPFFGCPRPLPLRERWRSLSINFLSLDMAIGFGAPTLSSAGVSVSLAGLALRRALCLGRVLTCLMTSTSIWSSKCTLGAERSAPLRAFSSISIAMVVVMMGAQGSGQRCVALARARSTVLRVARLRDSHRQLGSTPKALFARVP